MHRPCFQHFIDCCCITNVTHQKSCLWRMRVLEKRLPLGVLINSHQHFKACQRPHRTKGSHTTTHFRQSIDVCYITWWAWPQLRLGGHTSDYHRNHLKNLQVQKCIDCCHIRNSPSNDQLTSASIHCSEQMIALVIQNNWLSNKSDAIPHL